jgi:hypothetical protein
MIRGKRWPLVDLQYWTVLRVALVGAALSGALTTLNVKVGDEAPEILGKLIGVGTVGAILGALLAKIALPAAQKPVKQRGDLIAFSVTFAGIFFACMAEVKFVLNEHVGLKDGLRTTFLAGVAERCITKQNAAPENAALMLHTLPHTAIARRTVWRIA